MAMTDAVTIGVVDNDDMALRALRAIIGSLDAGFSVVWAVTSPSSAARRCMVPRTRPDVVVIDMAMDEMPGYELCGKIRGLCPASVSSASPRTRSITIAGGPHTMARMRWSPSMMSRRLPSR